MTESQAPLSQVPDASSAQLQPDGARLVLAADSTLAARAASKVAALIAAHRGLSGAAITVITAHADARSTEVGDAAITSQRTHQQLRYLPLARDGWQHEMLNGHPATEIVRYAWTCSAPLIVLGLRPHEMADRLFRDETALAVMQQARMPTLGVVASMSALPASVAVALDFSRASLSAMHVAASLMPAGGHLLLVHVAPELRMWTRAADGINSLYEERLVETFTQLVGDVQRRWPVHAEAFLLHGPVVSELRRFARRHAVDMLAVGKCTGADTHGVLGSVPTALARTANHSLLVVPAE